MADNDNIPHGGDTNDIARLRERRDRLSHLDVPDTVEELGRVDSADRAMAFRLLPKDRAIDVFEDLDPALQSELIQALRDDTMRELIEGLDPDDRAGLLEELPAAVVARLLSGLSPHE